jgi:uncharacterized protein
MAAPQHALLARLHKRKRWLVVFGALLVVVVGTEYVYQSLLFPGVGQEDSSPYRDANLKRYRDGDSVPVVTQEHHPRQGRGCTIVYFHGNGETVSSRWRLGETLAARGHTFVAMEYRGYGQARSGRPSEKALYADADRLLRRLKADGVATRRLLLWGYSLGSGIAAEMAYRGHGGRLVLESAFRSIPEVAAKAFPWLPLRFWIRDRFATAEKAAHIVQPTLLLHGGRDGLVPVQMAQDLAARLPTAELVVEPSAGHNDLWGRDPKRLFGALFRHLKGCEQSASPMPTAPRPGN